MLNRFKHPILQCFIALFVVMGVAGQSAAKQMPYGQGVLWQIQAPTGAAGGFLFGTLHLGDPSVTTLPEPVKRAFSRAGSLTVEIVMTKDTPAQMVRFMVLPPQQSLDQITGAPMFARVAAAGQRLGFQISTLRRLKPWAVAAAFSIPPDERAGQAAGRLPLDQLLQKAATQRGMPVFGLESIDEQLSVLDDLPMSDQIKMLS